MQLPERHSQKWIHFLAFVEVQRQTNLSTCLSLLILNYIAIKFFRRLNFDWIVIRTLREITKKISTQWILTIISLSYAFSQDNTYHTQCVACESYVYKCEYVLEFKFDEYFADCVNECLCTCVCKSKFSTNNSNTNTRNNNNIFNEITTNDGPPSNWCFTVNVC